MSAPAVGQRVGHADRRPVVDGARDEPGGGQVGEPVGEDGVRDAADRAREVAEPGAAVAEDSEDDRCPALAEEDERTREGGIAAHDRDTEAHVSERGVRESPDRDP
jgi:hypothetical protein